MNEVEQYVVAIMGVGSLIIAAMILAAFVAEVLK
jgi:hypothetical protein